MKKGFLSGAVLKNTAYITMFIDHFFAVVYLTLMRQYQAAGHEVGRMQQIYTVGRAVGRISFILFTYLAVEGFLHTRSRKKYLLRLGIFAIVSEFPFDLAFSDTYYDPGSQNVFFTLFLGILALTIWEWTAEKVQRYMEMKARCSPRQGILWCVRVFTLAFCAGAAYLLYTDYKFMGVLLIFAFYQTRDRRLPVQMLAAGCVMLFGTWSMNCLRYAGSYSAEYLFRFSLREMYGLFAFVWIGTYNGKKGHQLPKAFYYCFYPVHLLLLHWAAGIAVSGMWSVVFLVR